MANTLYDAARQRFLEGQSNWLTDTIKIILVDTGAYTPQTAIHQYLSDIPTSVRIAGPVRLTAKTTTGGAADGADVITAVSGASIEAIVISGTESTSPLIAYGFRRARAACGRARKNARLRALRVATWPSGPEWGHEHRGRTARKLFVGQHGPS